MKSVRQSRKLIRDIKMATRPRLYTWTGNKAFKRVRHKKYGRVALMLRDDEFLHFCSGIGFVEVNWAMFEVQLTRWCQVMFVTCKWRGADGKTRECPRPYSQKVRYARSGFRKIPRLAPWRDTGLDLLDRGDALADTRHDLTHAVITHMEAKDGKYFMTNYKVQRDGMHTVKDVVFDFRAFPNLSEKLADLASEAIHLSAQLITLAQKP